MMTFFRGWRVRHKGSGRTGTLKEWVTEPGAWKGQWVVTTDDGDEAKWSESSLERIPDASRADGSVTLCTCSQCGCMYTDPDHPDACRGPNPRRPA